MNRKNTILIAVLINAGLLAVLLIAALTTQEELPAQNTIAREETLNLPKFDDAPMYQELPLLAMAEMTKTAEPASEPVLHKLPPLVAESTPALSAPIPIPLPESQPMQIVKSEPASTTSLSEISVKKGDSLEKIARAHHTTVDEIIKLNHLPSSFLKIGQVLKIPTQRVLAKLPEKKAAEAGPEYYTMKVGENPWAIAIRHHMKLDELLRLNGLNEEKARKLKPGDRLRIR
jgi:peptidoglycan DL-endopeptidase LytF